MSKRVNRDEIDRFHDYNIYIPNRTLFMGSEDYDLESGESGTDGRMAERIIKNLNILETMSKEPTPPPVANAWSEPTNGLSGRLRVEFEDRGQHLGRRLGQRRPGSTIEDGIAELEL